MKLIIVSDLHFGDPECRFDPAAFFKTLDDRRAFDPPPDFLVLLGDIFDFSVSTYAEAFKAARPFFQALNGKVKDIIYVPGNHDGDFWHLIDNQINVLKPIEDGQPPQSLMMSCPGVLVDGPEGPNLFWTRPGKMNYKFESGRPDRYGLFVDTLVTGERVEQTIERVTKGGAEWPPRIWVAYPNLYLVNPEETILLTHGHYLETWWALGGEVVSRLLPQCFAPKETRDLGLHVQDGDRCTSIENTVGFNYPLSQLICSGLGQAGKLCRFAKTVQAQAKQHDTSVIDRIIKLLPDAAARSFTSPRAGAWDKVKTGAVKTAAAAGIGLANFASGLALKKTKPARGRDMFQDPEDEDRLKRYLFATELEVAELNRIASDEIGRGANEPGRDIKEAVFSPFAPPKKMIFGHTHKPIADWTDDDYTGLKYLNCGGFVSDGRAVGIIYEDGEIATVEFA